MTQTLSKMISQHPDTALALGGVEADWLTYGTLRTLSAEIGNQLHSCGLGRTDRVAIVLPNGPEMAAAFVTLAQWVVTAPLNPNYTKDEFSFYFKDLKSKAVVLPEDYSGPALDAAQALGTVVLRLKPLPEIGAGGFALTTEGAGLTGADRNTPNDGDEALILHTSGTTSRPKIVPLLHRNICASADHIATSLALSPADRCLNVMPLFHIHGLIAAVSASLCAGGQIFCTPGFDALRFFGWMSAQRPTWYTAVPTMHQAILSRAARNESIIADVPLRFLRSSSASLPPQVFASLEDAFGAPVIEAYGMTEAAHQMAANPLPPKPRKPGCVGIAAGPQLRIADETDNTLIDGLGEIVISGPNVTPGYESNPDANAKSFFEAGGARWFRTGDQGQLDADGYLTITGRLKEIINRGGEKISPREVDEVLMDHPAVAQAVTFAVPHGKLGEDVAAAVVLAQDKTATEQELSGFVQERLARFKVPRKIVIVAEIPKGATGKLQRIGLHEKLGLEL
ncbi:MAG: acyl--CoA ligase [Paracoccaceae bacterium]